MEPELPLGPEEAGAGHRRQEHGDCSVGLREVVGLFSVVQGLQDVVQLGWGAPLLPEIEKKILEIATICTAIVLRSAVFMRSFRIFLG